MDNTIQISKEIKRTLEKNAPEILETYQSCMDALEDIEIKD
ncbi:hypothetical protein [Nitrosopumilus sp.]|nr:hypothetical protein [Nitrosopumilus sp.]